MSECIPERSRPHCGEGRRCTMLFSLFLYTPHCTAPSGQSGSGTMASMTASTVLRGAHSSIFGESLPLETTTPPKLRTTSVASGPRRGEQPMQGALVSASRMHV